MAKMTMRKKAAKKRVARATGRPAASGMPIRLQKLIDNLAAIEPSGAGPCQSALARVKRALPPQALAKLGSDLAVLERAVAECPERCGCGRGLRRAVISSGGRILGELTSEGGKFSGLWLNAAGEDLLGEDLSRLRYLGISNGAVPVNARDSGFLNAFAAWCGAKGCDVLVFSETYTPVWAKLQAAKLDEESMLRLMDKLRDLGLDDAWRLAEGLGGSSEDVC